MKTTKTSKTANVRLEQLALDDLDVVVGGAMIQGVPYQPTPGRFHSMAQGAYGGAGPTSFAPSGDGVVHSYTTASGAGYGGAGGAGFGSWLPDAPVGGDAAAASATAGAPPTLAEWSTALGDQLYAAGELVNHDAAGHCGNADQPAIVHWDMGGPEHCAPQEPFPVNDACQGQDGQGGGDGQSDAIACSYAGHDAPAPDGYLA